MNEDPFAPASVFAPVDATGGAGFAHHDLGEQWQRGLEPLPDPACQVFAGGIFQTLDLIQIMMIELLVERLEGAGQIGEVQNPAGLLLHRPGNMNLDAKRVPMQAPALVSLRDIGQMMRGFESEYLEYFHGMAKSESGWFSLTTFSVRENNRKKSHGQLTSDERKFFLLGSLCGIG